MATVATLVECPDHASSLAYDAAGRISLSKADDVLRVFIVGVLVSSLSPCDYVPAPAKVPYAHSLL